MNLNKFPFRNIYTISVRLALLRYFDAVRRSCLKNKRLFFSNISSSSFNFYSLEAFRAATVHNLRIEIIRAKLYYNFAKVKLSWSQN